MSNFLGRTSRAENKTPPTDGGSMSVDYIPARIEQFVNE